MPAIDMGAKHGELIRSSIICSPAVGVGLNHTAPKCLKVTEAIQSMVKLDQDFTLAINSSSKSNKNVNWAKLY
jgi:hypothetical protein